MWQDGCLGAGEMGKAGQPGRLGQGRQSRNRRPGCRVVSREKRQEETRQGGEAVARVGVKLGCYTDS